MFFVVAYRKERVLVTRMLTVAVRPSLNYPKMRKNIRNTVRTKKEKRRRKKTTGIPMRKLKSHSSS